MEHKTNNFEHLGSLIKQAEAENSIIAILSSPSSSAKSITKAKCSLKSKVSDTLDNLMVLSSVYNYETINKYNDSCRHLMAYLLVFGKDDKLFRRAFIKAIELMICLAPSFKHELRSLRREFVADRAYVRELGFVFEDLSIPFIPDRFATKFLNTTIAQEAAPEVVVVEKKVIVEKEVEKVVVKEKEIIVEKEKEDINDFGCENRYVEHKQNFFFESYNEKPMAYNVCREICAFLNAEGGKIYIGVSDNGRALPKYQGGFPSGVRDEVTRLQRANRLPFGKTSVDSYCIAVKREITNRFRDSNDISKFINDIHVEETKNENVIVIDVPKSRYCVVRLEGIAFQRSGSECKAMDQTQIEQRNQELLSVSKEVHFMQLLHSAIQNRKQVILYSYESTNSATIENRYVEPINFVCENQSIICYDTVKQGIRQFKLSRIGDVKVLETDWQFDEIHGNNIGADIFGWTDHGNNYDICLDMLLPAKTALLERHPNAKKDSFVNLGNGYWRLETKVFSLDPVMSFYMGMADSIVIQETKDTGALKRMIRDYVQNFIISSI